MNSVNHDVFSVRLGENADRGMYRKNARYNFLFSLVDSDDTDHSLTSLSPFSILVAAGSSVRKMIRIGQDYNFWLQNAQFSAYYLSGGTYYFFENNINNQNDAMDTSEVQMLKGTPYERYIQVALSVSAPNANYLYGGPSFSSNNAGRQVPVGVLTFQGNTEGYGSLKTPYLLPKNGVVQLEIFNRHTHNDLYVAGYLYGEKVRV